MKGFEFAAIGINRQMLPVFLGLLLVVSIAWIFLSNRLYSALEQKYPSLYGKLGSPNFFMPRSIVTNLKVIRFLLKREFEKLNDPQVVRLCDGLRALLYIYAVCLAGCFIVLLG